FTIRWTAPSQIAFMLSGTQHLSRLTATSLSGPGLLQKGGPEVPRRRLSSLNPLCVLTNIISISLPRTVIKETWSTVYLMEKKQSEMFGTWLGWASIIPLLMLKWNLTNLRILTSFN